MPYCFFKKDREQDNVPAPTGEEQRRLNTVVERLRTRGPYKRYLDLSDETGPARKAPEPDRHDPAYERFDIFNAAIGCAGRNLLLDSAFQTGMSDAEGEARLHGLVRYCWACRTRAIWEAASRQVQVKGSNGTVTRTRRPRRKHVENIEELMEGPWERESILQAIQERSRDERVALIEAVAKRRELVRAIVLACHKNVDCIVDRNFNRDVLGRELAKMDVFATYNQVTRALTMLRELREDVADAGSDGDE